MKAFDRRKEYEKKMKDKGYIKCHMRIPLAIKKEIRAYIKNRINAFNLEKDIHSIPIIKIYTNNLKDSSILLNE